MASDNHEEIIQYVPFISFVHPSFWHTLTEYKLDVAGLIANAKEINGRFSYRDDLKTVFEVDGTSFNTEPQEEPFYINVTGSILNQNTIEGFKEIDKANFLNNIGAIVSSKLFEKTWIQNPSDLLSFVILSFADLKKFNYYYWFAFPCPSQPTVYTIGKPRTAKSTFNDKELNEITEGFNALPQNQKCYFLVVPKESNMCVCTLSNYMDKNTDTIAVNTQISYFAFADSSNGENPGWPLRMLIAALLHHSVSLRGTVLKILALRSSPNGSIGNSMIYNIKVPEDIEHSSNSGWIGWERNDKGKFGPRLANMSASMDPITLADTSSDLNIKLMKWRLVADLDVDIMKKTKCLLLGAGTLGCHVARNLLAWGFRHITFVDSGKVSYSNPTRQVLYNYHDCLAGGRFKAEAAAENLRNILPSVKSRGVVAHIPMPGHPVGEALKDETLLNYKALRKEINEHDVIFLLLDTREARWLPALLGAVEKKVVINAALGFDTYLVMRHGVGLAPIDATDIVARAYVPGGQLGCYFCNDVTAPGDSVRERTLDQQCTVSRPGAAAVAAALAVELLAALLQHPLRAEAPAVYNIAEDEDTDPEITQGHLGLVPHSIRGFLHSFRTVTPTCTKFKQCIACSDVVINEYKEHGVAFLLKVLNSATYLEEVTGLTELQISAKMTEVLMLSDEEDME